MSDDGQRLDVPVSGSCIGNSYRIASMHGLTLHGKHSYKLPLDLFNPHQHTLSITEISVDHPSVSVEMPSESAESAKSWSIDPLQQSRLATVLINTESSPISRTVSSCQSSPSRPHYCDEHPAPIGDRIATTISLRTQSEQFEIPLEIEVLQRPCQSPPSRSSLTRSSNSDPQNRSAGLSLMSPSFNVGRQIPFALNRSPLHRSLLLMSFLNRPWLHISAG